MNEIATAVVAVLGALLGGGGLVTGAFHWLAKRDDRREAERTAERREFLDALKAQQDGCKEELASITAADREDRALDREARRSIAERNHAALTELRAEVGRLGQKIASGEHRSVGGA